MKRTISFVAFVMIALVSFSQKPSWWRAEIKREDGNIIPFNFESRIEKGKQVWYIRNATEHLKVDSIRQKGDSLFVSMPLFESAFKLKLLDASMNGIWIKGTSSKDQVLPITITYGQSERFIASKKPVADISGRWAVNFVSTDSTDRIAIGEFKQNENHLTGTFLTMTGDYRYLEGVVDGDSMKLSTFDGSHAYYFVAKIISKDSIAGGHYYSGARGHQEWSAHRDAAAKLPDDASAVYLKEGEERLDFSFPDINGKKVSIDDKRFKNKVVIVQIMGSWCPNCMDETKFLSDFYRKNKSRGVEVVSLAYEYSDDFARSQKSLRKFQQRFNVQYPMLITGAKTSDTLRTEKTLPQITPIRMFPTTIFIGKDGKVKKIDTGFAGPGTGEHYLEFVRRFNQTVDRLLKE